MKPKYVERDVVLVNDPQSPGEWTVQMMREHPKFGLCYALRRMEDGQDLTWPVSEQHDLVPVRTSYNWEREQGR